MAKYPKIAPIAISLICFAYCASFLVRHGDMLPRGSDVVGNTAYAMTMFGDVYHAGWSVPKPGHMLVYGLTYFVTRSLWFVNMVSIAAAALLIYCVCRLMDKVYGMLAFVFAVFVMATPFSFGAVIGSGSGLLSTLGILAAILYINRPGSLKNRVAAVIFLCLANLMRPDNWVSSYLVIFFVFALKYVPKARPKFEKADLLFLIPLGMPVVWHLMDYAVFGDLFYSTRLAQKFVLEYASRRNTFDWHKYPGLIKSSFFKTFYLSSWLSVKTFAFIILSIAGIVSMFMKQRRILLFMACPFFGTIFFYFVTYINGMLFLNRFLFYNYIFILVLMSAGLAQLSNLFLRLPVRYLRNFLQVSTACLIAVSIVYAPFKASIMGSMMPGFKARASVVKKQEKAIDALKSDIDADSSRDMGNFDPVVATTLAIQSSRIALALHTGRDIYLLERLIGLEKLGKEDFIPDLSNRIVYLGYQKSVKGDVKGLIQKIEMGAGKTEIIYDKDGLKISRSLYGDGQ